MILPSAGEMMIFSRDGIFRFGFLKKKAMNSVNKIPKKVNSFHPIKPRTTVSKAAGMRNGRPSLAMGH
jgi:hypothetical protein